MGSFSANGMSNAQNVQVIGISIRKLDEVTVNLRYNAKRYFSCSDCHCYCAPCMAYEQYWQYDGTWQWNGHDAEWDGCSMMSGGQPMMTPWNNGIAIANNTQWQQWHTQMAKWHEQLNSTEWQQMQAWHNQIMAQMPQTQNTLDQATFLQCQTGSSVVSSG